MDFDTFMRERLEEIRRGADIVADAADRAIADPNSLSVLTTRQAELDALMRDLRRKDGGRG